VSRGPLPATLAGREAPPARRSVLRWTPVALLGGAAFFLLISVVGSAVPGLTTDGAAAPATTTAAAPPAATSRSRAPATTTPTQSATATATATATPAATTPANPLVMTDAQRTKTTQELTDLAGRLPAGVSLTAPAAWARWAGATPSWARDVDGCPHIAARMAASLGAGRWTYVYGTMPQGGCTWVPVPWIPNQPAAERFVVTVEFEQGAVPALLQRLTSCAGGDAAPTVDVPAVASGAVLSGCDDADGPNMQLALPDAGGTGAWFLGATSGQAQTTYAPEQALLALVDATRAVYR
jgi:hypothetical protein